MSRQFNVAKKHVLVLGMGLSGRSAARFLLAYGAQVHGVDKDQKLLRENLEIQELLPQGLEVSSDLDLAASSGYDLIVLSPGVPQTHPMVQQARLQGLPVIGEIELGCRVANNPILGITGTNGKTTVTLLVNHVLNQCGVKAQALGNVGAPLTKELLTLDSATTIVLELSSYQIETLFQPVLEVGVILNITPDHLDRYGTMEAYAKAKCAMARCLKPHASLYMEESAWKNYGNLFDCDRVRIYGYAPDAYICTNLKEVFKAGKKAFELPLPLRGRKGHDVENLLAAFAICAEKGVEGADFIHAMQTFSKPAHRIEFVAEHKGVRYFDDSKGTNLDAVIRAVQSLDGSIVLVAGGVDKGAPYTPWIEEFKDKVKLICAIGQAAVKIKDQMAPQIPVVVFDSLEEAVKKASQLAKSGEIVLLSPGCSSFDMFKDYAHRGEEFKRIVHELINCARTH